MLDDVKLINLVKQNPILYNPYHLNYMDVGMKLTIWTEIGAKLNSDGERCKTRWNNIRDNFNKYLKKVRHHKSVKPYRFAWQMGFLKKYLNERGEGKGNRNVTVQEDTIPEFVECKTEPLSEEVHEEEAVNEDNGSVVTTPDCEVVISVPQPQTQTQPRSFRKRKMFRETPSMVLMKYLLEKKSAVTRDQPTLNLEHPVDAFLFSLSSSLKSLPEHLLTLAKSEIFACVQEYEKRRHCQEKNEMNNVDSEESEEDEKPQRTYIDVKGRKRTTIRGDPYLDSCTGSVTPTAMSSMTTMEPSQKKPKLIESIPGHNESACQVFSSFTKETEETKDEYYHLAKVWTCKLKALVPMQKRLAERAINEIFFEADLGTLHRNSVQINHFPDPTSVTSRHSSNLSDIGSNFVTGSEPPVNEPTFPSSSSSRPKETVLFP